MVISNTIEISVKSEERAEEAAAKPESAEKELIEAIRKDIADDYESETNPSKVSEAAVNGVKDESREESKSVRFNIADVGM